LAHALPSATTLPFFAFVAPLCDVHPTTSAAAAATIEIELVTRRMEGLLETGSVARREPLATGTTEVLPAHTRGASPSSSIVAEVAQLGQFM
jgi:hypothetical protein